MRYRQLGNTGVRVSEVSLGAGGQFALLDQPTIDRIVGASIEAGVNYFDTANIYPVLEDRLGGELSEIGIGKALAGRRHEIVLGSKGMQRTGPGVNERGASRYNLMNALEASLRRLQTDHVDLYQIHLFDPQTPTEEVMRTLDDMVSQGKVRYVGASQYQSWQICRANDLAERYGWVKLATTQAQYHLLDREVERELIPFCREMKVGLLPFFPMANGLLSGKYRPDAKPEPGSRAATFKRAGSYQQRYGTPANLAKIERLKAWSAERGHALPELAIAWLLTEPCVSSVVAGVSKVEQAVTNARASDWQLTPEEAAEVRAVLEE